MARVGQDKRCCVDLHALVPAPGDILRLGRDYSDALRWLWDHWGTTKTFRRVTLALDRHEAAPAGTVFRVILWTADWTPCQALASVRARSPGLRFDVQPHCGRA